MEPALANSDTPGAEPGKGQFRAASNTHHQMGPRVTAVTLYDSSMSEVGDLCVRSVRRFLLGSAIDEFKVFTGFLDDRLPPSWNKIVAVQSILAGTDWVFWMDADCVVHRPFDMKELTQCSAHFRPSLDYNGVNSGVFLLRNCAWSHEFLKTILFLGDVEDPTVFGPFDGPKWEQNTIKCLAKSFGQVSKRIDPLPTGLVSDPVTGFQESSAVYHAFAMDNRSRLEVLTNIYNRAGQEANPCLGT
jgi:hypothetical protein